VNRHQRRAAKARDGMTPDERAAFVKEAEDHGWDLYVKMFDLLMTEQRPDIALNIAMNLVAHLISDKSLSREQAELSAERAVAELLIPMVRLRWMSAQDTGVTAN
jgi:hypothetical protein